MRGTVVLHRPASEITPYLTDGSVHALGAHRRRVEMGAWSWAALTASIARADADIEDVHPPEFAQAFPYIARRAARPVPKPLGTAATRRGCAF